MSNRLLKGFWRYMLPIPAALWQKEIAKLKHKMKKGLGFMTEEHRMIHHFVVKELPYMQGPLSPELIAKKLGISLARVTAILDELEKHMTFLFRNSEGAVVWAYPVTVEATPHHVTFSTGEQVYAA